MSKTLSASVRRSIATRACPICFLRINVGDRYLRTCVQRGKHNLTLHYCMDHARLFAFTDPTIHAALEKSKAAQPEGVTNS